MGTQPHKIETPRPDRYVHRPLFDDGKAFVNAVAQQMVVACAGATTAWVRILTETSGGSLAVRLRRTNGDEYPVALGPADTAVVAGTLLELPVTLKGVKEFVLRFTPTGNGVFTYVDVSMSGPGA